MRDKYIPAFITLTAGAITCIIDIYRKAELVPSLIRLLVVLIIFYVLGLIARAIIRKALQPKPRKNEEEGIGETTEESKKDFQNKSDDNSEDNLKGKTNDNPKSKG